MLTYPSSALLPGLRKQPVNDFGLMGLAGRTTELNLVNTEIGLRQNSTSATAAYSQSDDSLYADSQVSIFPSKSYVCSGSKLLFQLL